jgi:DNA-binding protein H-NS
MNEQEHYEHQLYQLSQRLTLQNQLNEQEEQQRQYQQQWAATRQTLENILSTLSLTAPEEVLKLPGWQSAKANCRYGRKIKPDTARYRSVLTP